MFLVERLGDLERALGTQAEAGVRLALESREIVKLRGDLRGGLFFLCDDARLAVAFCNNRLSCGAIPNALGFRILLVAFFEALAEPAATIRAGSDTEITINFKIRTRLEGADFFLTLGQDREGRRLHAADGRELESPALGVESGHGTSGIDAYEPITFAATYGGIREWNHLFSGTQMRKAFADRFGRHALQPQAAGRLFRVCELNDVMKNQLPFAAGVAGINDICNIRTLQQALDHAQTGGGFFDRLEIKVVWDDREIRKTPLAPLLVHFVWQAKLNKVADSRSNYQRIIFKKIILAGEFAEGLCKIPGYRGFFGNDKGFGHDREVVTKWRSSQPAGRLFISRARKL